VAAGALAVIISRICLGWDLRDSVDYALEDIRRRDSAQETVEAVEAALSLSRSGREPGPDVVEELGGGWVAEEALAIALYCSLVSRDLRSGLLLAVNHSGDSDSTGAITGNILGALHGEAAVPQEWVALLDQREVVELIATDWVTAFIHGTGAGDSEQDLFATAYPGW
jgi:ADP-ribosylglycohydrolase